MENIFTASKPFLNLAKFLGVFPMSFHGPTREGLLKIRCFYVLISIVWLVTAVSLLVIAASFDYVFESSNVLTIAWALLIKLEHCSIIFNFCYQIYKRKKALKFLLKVNESDEMVKRFKMFKIA